MGATLSGAQGLVLSLCSEMNEWLISHSAKGLHVVLGIKLLVNVCKASTLSLKYFSSSQEKKD